MSMPIKPSGPHPSPMEGAGATEGAPGGSVEERPGELRSLVGEAGQPSSQASGASHDAAPVGGRVESLRAELAAGHIDVEQALDRLLERALASAPGMSAARRATLEAQLRAALVEDPTLIALRKDLERASHS